MVVLVKTLRQCSALTSWRKGVQGSAWVVGGAEHMN